MNGRICPFGQCAAGGISRGKSAGFQPARNLGAWRKDLCPGYTDSIRRWAKTGLGRLSPVLQYVHWVTESLRDQSARSGTASRMDKGIFPTWCGRSICAFSSRKMSPLFPPGFRRAKRLEIRLAEQVIAYESVACSRQYVPDGDRGAAIDGDYRTQPGRYITNRKRPSRHMAVGDPAAPSSYDLPGIPGVLPDGERRFLPWHLLA